MRFIYTDAINTRISEILSYKKSKDYSLIINICITSRKVKRISDVRLTLKMRCYGNSAEDKYKQMYTLCNNYKVNFSIIL